MARKVMTPVAWIWWTMGAASGSGNPSMISSRGVTFGGAAPGRSWGSARWRER
jgi:hypothetical protein